MICSPLERIRVEHVASLLRYLNEEERRGLHVTDIVYGCPYYAKWVVSERASNNRRNVDEAGLIRLVVGKLLHTIPFGKWHHVKVMYRDLLEGEIDDILFLDDVLYVVDKKTVVERPPKEAHGHYQKQVQTYIFMLKNGKILTSEKGDVEELKKLVGEKMIKGAILYVDISASTRTVVSDVLAVDYSDVVGDWVDWMIDEVMKDEPTKCVSWFCHYCPIMNLCWGEGNE